MGTIINSLSDFYYDFFNGDAFSMEKAQRFFNKCADTERHANYVKEVYETILSSLTINETSKILIRTHKSYAETARYYNSIHEQEINETANSDKPYRIKTADLVKADIYYTNRKLSSILRNTLYDDEYPQKDYFSLVIFQSKISDTAWSKANDALEQLKISLNGKLISKEIFWLNIPIKDYNKQLSDGEFNQLLSLIKPYFNSQKAIAQLKLNSMQKEAGYLNYILKANMDNSLSEIDAARRDIILTLSDRGQVQRFKESTISENSEQYQENPLLYQYQTQLLQLKEESENEKQQRIKIMSKVGQIYYQTNGNPSEKHQFAIDTLSKQYAQLKQISQNRQQRIDQLQIEIQKLKEQMEEKQKISSII